MLNCSFSPSWVSFLFVLYSVLLLYWGCIRQAGETQVNLGGDLGFPACHSPCLITLTINSYKTVNMIHVCRNFTALPANNNYKLVLSASPLSTWKPPSMTSQLGFSFTLVYTLCSCDNGSWKCIPAWILNLKNLTSWRIWLDRT